MLSPTLPTNFYSRFLTKRSRPPDLRPMHECLIAGDKYFTKVAKVVCEVKCIIKECLYKTHNVDGTHVLYDIII